MPRTPKLTDLQLILLSTAAARDDGNVFPVKDCIAGKTGEMTKATNVLLKRELIVEQPETILDRVWREDDDGHIGLAITDAGQALVDGAAGSPEADAATDTSAADVPAPVPPAPPRTGSKIADVLTLLRQPSGATSAAMVEATGWLPHTLRAALTGLRKKGHVLERVRQDDTTSYRIVAEG